MDPRRIDETQIREAAALLRKGKIVIFPTETVYGIGAALSQKSAIERIYALKDRDQMKPLTWHLADYDYFNSREMVLPPLASELSWRFMPGPFTMIVRMKNEEVLGIRFPDHPVARQLIEAVGEPVLATSVNKAGEEPAVSGKRAARLFDGQVDLILDSGVTRFGTDSTIVDLTKSPPEVVRRGPFSSEIETFLKSASAGENPESEHILFVCTGNTCRSVMAAAWLSAEIKKKKLEDRISVFSCGTSAMEGASPAPEAVQAVRSVGAELIGHQARPLSKKLLHEATRIFAMTAGHVDAIVALNQGAAKKVTVLGVSDPLGMDLRIYREALSEIQSKMRTYLSWLAE